jgi:hypothetical protein
VVSEVDPEARSGEDDRSRDQHLRLGSGVVVGVRSTLRQRDVPCLPDESLEVGVGDCGRIHPVAVDAHLVCGRLFRVVLV